MDHGPAVPMGEDKASEIKSKIGIRMVIIYGIIYFGFILINTLSPQLMETKIIFGVNLAVVYGFSLILLAIILGLFYNDFCTKKENELNTPSEEEGGDKWFMKHHYFL